VEHSQRVGLVTDFETQDDVWAKVEELGLKELFDNPIAVVEDSMGDNPAFGRLAEHWRQHDLKKCGVIAKRALETVKCHESNLDGYVLPKWGAVPALAIKPPMVEEWFEQFASEPQSKALLPGKTPPNGYKPRPLEWGTIQKIKSVMSLVYGHAMRYELIPAEERLNPFRSTKKNTGGVRCAVISQYEATVVSPEQAISILHYLDTQATQMEWTLVLLHAATAVRGEEGFSLKWWDVDWENGEIWIQRGWSKGRETEGKNHAAKSPVAMHPVLAEILRQWREVTLYPAQKDWIFPSLRLKGEKPRSASTAAKDYLRPAAVFAGVIEEGSSKRFGWHNLRHSLATFLSGKVELAEITQMLRQTQVQTTMRYTHRVPERRREAQGRFLKALKLTQAETSKVQ
jgi:integrase